MCPLIFRIAKVVVLQRISCTFIELLCAKSLAALVFSRRRLKKKENERDLEARVKWGEYRGMPLFSYVARDLVTVSSLVIILSYFLYNSSKIGQGNVSSGVDLV